MKQGDSQVNTIPVSWSVLTSGLKPSRASGFKVLSRGRKQLASGESLLVKYSWLAEAGDIPHLGLTSSEKGRDSSSSMSDCKYLDTRQKKLLFLAFPKSLWSGGDKAGLSQ